MFGNLLAKFWADEFGGVIATEYLMLGTIVAAGSSTGLVAMRDSMVNEYKEFGQSVRDIREAHTSPILGKRPAKHTDPTYPPLMVSGYQPTEPVTFSQCPGGVCP
jgi:hypothetical protein